MIKKMVPIAFCLLIWAGITTSLAAEPKWEEIYAGKDYRNQDARVYLDTSSHAIYHKDNKLYIECWVKHELENNDTIMHTYFRADDLLYMDEQISFYQKDGKLIKTLFNTEKVWSANPSPGYQKQWLEATRQWIQNHMDSSPPRRGQAP